MQSTTSSVLNLPCANYFDSVLSLMLKHFHKQVLRLKLLNQFDFLKTKSMFLDLLGEFILPSTDLP
jgi:hypothetical protein